MRLLDSLLGRDRVAESEGDPGSPAMGEDQLPIAGYDRLRADRVTDQLPRLSQTDLSRVEVYERSHQDRPEVLDKLRYLRGNEPLPGYDALDAGEVTAALKGADLHTLTMVREYEMKFRRRDEVMEQLARVRRERRSGEQA
jgi:hypothetical protein